MSVGGTHGRRELGVGYCGDVFAYLQSRQMPLVHEHIADELLGFRVSKALEAIG
jgi:hypothetical protein